MLALAVLLALQSLSPSGSNDSIVITARRLDAVRFNLSVNRLTGEMKCTVARSSTDPAIDEYMCDVAKYCARTSRKTRQAIEQCIALQKQAYLSQYRGR